MSEFSRTAKANKNRVVSVSPESSNQALSDLPPSGRSTIHERHQGGVASSFGAPMFPVELPSGDSTTSLMFAPQGNEARSDLLRGGLGTLNARAGQPEEEGMEVDSDFEASDKSMPTEPPAFTDEEMPSRSPTPSDTEMEDLSMAFRTLYRSPPQFPNQNVEMEDLSMDFNMLFGDASSSRHQDEPEAQMAQMDGGSAPVSAVVSCTGVAEANAEESSTPNASFWSGNRTVFGPGSPMDYEVVEAESIEVNPMPVTTIHRVITSDATSIHDSTDGSAKEVERVSAQGNEESPRQEPLKPSETTEPTATNSPDSFNRSNPSTEMPQVAIPTTNTDVSDLNATPEASKSPEPGDNNSEEDGEPLENGQAEESPQLHLSTSANEIMNTTDSVSEPSPSKLAARPTEAESAPMQKQPAKKKPMQKPYGFNTDPDPKPAQLALKRNPGHCSEEPPRKIRKVMPQSSSEAAEEKVNANEAEIPQVADSFEEVASVAASIQSGTISPAMSHVSGEEADELPAQIEAEEVNAPIEVANLDAIVQEADQQNVAYWMNIAQADYDQAGEDEPGQPWMYEDLPDDDDNTIYDEPPKKLIDTDDNMSSDEEEHGNAPENIQAQPSIAPGMPSDDDPSDSSDDDDADGHVPERDVSPSPAPSVRPSTPVTPANGPQIGEVEELAQFDDVETEDAPIEQVNDNGNIIEIEPANIEADIPPMDDNIDAESVNNGDDEPDNHEVAPMDDMSEAEDVDVSDSDDTTVPSDVDTDQLVSEGSSDESEDESMDVDEPEDLLLAAPQAAKPRSRNAIDPWKTVNSVESFADVTLPAPNNVIVKSMYVQEFDPLTPDQLKQEVSGDDYIAALYNGIVVLQGSFDGVPLSSALLSEAAVRPQVLYNDPTDPIKWMGGGRNHLVLLGESGRLYLIGRAAEGQLGQDPSRHRYRAPSPLNMRRRVLEKMEIGPNGKPKVRSTPEIEFDDVEAAGNVTIAWSNNLAFMCGTSEDGAECWSSFKRYPRRDRNQGMDAATLH